jgi:hypothetical protein
VPIRNFLQSQQEKARFTRLVVDAAGIEQHLALADGAEIILHFKVFQYLVARQDGFEQFPWFLDIPLALANDVILASANFQIAQ